MWFLAYFLLHLVIYTLIRVEFLVWNWPSLRELTGSELALAFLHGVRFDLSAMAPLVGLCLVVLPWLSKIRLLKRFWLFLFIIINGFFILINTADVELFNFTAKRFTSGSFFLAQEAHVSNLIAPYAGLAGVSVLLVLAYMVLAVRMALRFNYVGSWQKNTIATVLILLLSVVFSRGGFQMKPITFVDARIFNNAYANNLVLNSSFTILRSASQRSLPKQKFFENSEMLSLLVPQDIAAAELAMTKPNIVIVILESFSEEYSRLRSPEVMPFFNKIRRQGIDFKSGFANGRRSIEGIAAILSGIPALMEEPFISSEFSTNQVIGLGTILASHGYKTSFFHGTRPGSMHFDSFTKSVGIQKHFSLNDYPNADDYDGTWGIFDEPFLKWACEKLPAQGTPFFSSIFTLSSHHPYKLPERYGSRFQDSRHEILKSIKYADYALEQFMKCAEQQPWSKETLFIFTADHTGPALNDNESFKSRYEVPLVFYTPDAGRLKGLDADQLAQHIDILPTVLDILKIENKNRNYLARSLLRKGPKFVALYSDGHYELVGDVTNPERQLKAVQQYFSEGMYDNRLYYPSK